MLVNKGKWVYFRMTQHADIWYRISCFVSAVVGWNLRSCVQPTTNPYASPLFAFFLNEVLTEKKSENAGIWNTWYIELTRIKIHAHRIHTRARARIHIQEYIHTYTCTLLCLTPVQNNRCVPCRAYNSKPDLDKGKEPQRRSSVLPTVSSSLPICVLWLHFCLSPAYA